MEINSCEFEGLVSFEEINSYKLAKEVKHHEKVFIKYEECEDGKKLKLRKKKKKFSPKTDFSTNKSDYSRRTLLKNSTVKDENTAKRKCDEKHEESPISTKKLALKIDVESWKAIFTPDVVIEAIKELGFREPSAIQKLTIPAAIKGRKDIVGAAETGSGKTLAFVIPIIHGILKEREKDTFENKNEHLNGENDSEEETNDEFDTESNSSDNEENFEENIEEERETGCVKVINDIHFDFEADENHNANVASKKKLRALIVTPTRELAVQIKKHADAVLSKTDIKSAVVIGGLSREKQERILSRGPEIVIGTPGRLWELVQQGNSHLIQLPEIRFFAVDETDRMLEKGHFEELQHLLEMINGDTESKRRRQNFIFSATLTLTHGPPKRLSAKKKVIKLTSEMKIENLMKLIGVREKPKIVDITRKFGTAEMLSEAKIFCDRDEKDSYLYYFLNRFPGRTLIFCNSINCVRRLSNLLTLLQCKPRALHASKQQKQRLKSLERFASDRTSVLLATDVAARGIDIPDVDHIVHYEVPRTAETYIHRSGRTARANQEGLSVILVDSTEVGKYRQLCGTLNRSSDLPSFPVNEEMLDGVKERVELAREIEKMQHGTKKRSTDDAWLQKMAEEAGIELGGSSDDDDFACELALGRKRSNCELKEKKSRLTAFLSRPLTTISFSGRYPTSTGKLLLPTQSLLNHDSAAPIDLLKQQKKIKLLPKISTVRRKKNKKLKNKRK